MGKQGKQGNDGKERKVKTRTKIKGEKHKGNKEKNSKS